MLPTQLEFEITQLLEGALSPQQEAMLRRELDADPQARLLLEEHQRLDALLNHIEPLPTVDWEMLHMQIAQAVNARRTQAARPRQPWRQLALAASVLLALGVGMSLLTRHPTARSGSDVAIVQVSGFQLEPSPGGAVAQISIGPPAGTNSDASFASFIADDPQQTAPPSIIIATGRQPAQDTMLLALAR